MTPKHKYNIPELLASVVGYKGVPFPGGFLSNRPSGGYETDQPDITPGAEEREELVKGTRLRKLSERGIWYYMPVYFRHPSIKAQANARGTTTDNTLEILNAIISITGKKTIVETPMVGRKGSVKELISVDDYEIQLAMFVQSPDGKYPEAGITQMRELFDINESLEFISVLTDLVLDEGDRVVITDIEYPSTPGVEDGQAVRLTMLTDKEFELIIS